MITFNTAEGIKIGVIIKFYSCGHRYHIRAADKSTWIVDQQQIIPSITNQSKRPS